MSALAGWGVEHSRELLAALDVLLIVGVAWLVRAYPGARATLAEAIGEQVARQVALQVAAQIDPVRKDLAELRQVFDGCGIVLGQTITKDTSTRLELLLADPNAEPGRN